MPNRGSYCTGLEAFRPVAPLIGALPVQRPMFLKTVYSSLESVPVIILNIKHWYSTSSARVKVNGHTCTSGCSNTCQGCQTRFSPFSNTLTYCLLQQQLRESGNGLYSYVRGSYLYGWCYPWSDVQVDSSVGLSCPLVLGMHIVASSARC